MAESGAPVFPERACVCLVQLVHRCPPVHSTQTVWDPSKAKWRIALPHLLSHPIPPSKAISTLMLHLHQKEPLKLHGHTSGHVFVTAVMAQILQATLHGCVPVQLPSEVIWALYEHRALPAWSNL